MYGILTSRMLEYIDYERVLWEGILREGLLRSRYDADVSKPWVNSQKSDSLYERSEDWWPSNGLVTSARLSVFPSSSSAFP